MFINSALQIGKYFISIPIVNYSMQRLHNICNFMSICSLLHSQLHVELMAFHDCGGDWDIPVGRQFGF